MPLKRCSLCGAPTAGTRWDGIVVRPYFEFTLCRDCFDRYDEVRELAASKSPARRKLPER